MKRDNRLVDIWFNSRNDQFSDWFLFLYLLDYDMVGVDVTRESRGAQAKLDGRHQTRSQRHGHYLGRS